MVIPKKVKHGMNGQIRNLAFKTVAVFLSLSLGMLYGDHYVSQSHASVLFGRLILVVFAERDISLMAEYVFQKHPNMDIVAVCYLPAGVSFRTRRDDINLSEICRKSGGGGHQKAAAFYLKRDTVGRAVDVILG